ncbi:MAG TPA: hypothetical protein GX002_01200 [Clostridiales bacterium]|nr:hypothetical protein [Clostridiales bacterium]
MKRKVCIILFGTSFLVAILGEAYLLNAAQPHIFSIIGIGIVVILTGFLFFDSVWEYISSEISKKELLREKEASQYSEKLDERCSELLNIQKATYAALKKSDIKLQEEIKELSEKLTQVIRTQNKIMNGQAKALNIILNYSKKHAKEIIRAIIEEQRGSDNNSTTDKAESEITPLYDDPNANLTVDEIAHLFENYGK